MVDYVAALPILDSEAEPTNAFNLLQCMTDLLVIAEKSPANNNVVVPVLQTINVLMDADLLLPLGEFAAGCET